MKIGLLGTNFGMAHLGVIANHPLVDGVVVCGRNKDKLEKIRQDHGVEISTDIEAVIAREDLDIITICLPSALHKEYAIKALEQGKHVFSEIPLGLTVEDSEEVMAAQQRSGKRLLANMYCRFLPANRHLHDAIADNRYGKLRSLHVTNNGTAMWGDRLLSLPLKSMIMDGLCSTLDMLIWCMGSPNTISVLGTEHAGRMASTHTLLDYGETIVSISESSMLPRGYDSYSRYEAIFEDGALEYEEVAYSQSRDSIRLTEYTDGKIRNLNIPSVNVYSESINHALACIHSGAGSLLEAKDTLISQRLGLQALQDLNKH